MNEDEIDRILLRCAREDPPVPVERVRKQEPKVGFLTFFWLWVFFSFVPWRWRAMLFSGLMAQRSLERDNEETEA